MLQFGPCFSEPILCSLSLGRCVRGRGENISTSHDHRLLLEGSLRSITSGRKFCFLARHLLEERYEIRFILTRQRKLRQRLLQPLRYVDAQASQLGELSLEL